MGLLARSHVERAIIVVALLLNNWAAPLTPATASTTPQFISDTLQTTISSLPTIITTPETETITLSTTPETESAISQFTSDTLQTTIAFLPTISTSETETTTFSTTPATESAILQFTSDTLQTTIAFLPTTSTSETETTTLSTTSATESAISQFTSDTLQTTIAFLPTTSTSETETTTLSTTPATESAISQFTSDTLQNTISSLPTIITTSEIETTTLSTTPATESAISQFTSDTRQTTIAFLPTTSTSETETTTLSTTPATESTIPHFISDTLQTTISSLTTTTTTSETETTTLILPTTTTTVPTISASLTNPTTTLPITATILPTTTTTSQFTSTTPPISATTSPTTTATSPITTTTPPTTTTPLTTTATVLTLSTSLPTTITTPLSTATTLQTTRTTTPSTTSATPSTTTAPTIATIPRTTIATIPSTTTRVCSPYCTSHGCSSAGSYRCDQCDHGYGLTSNQTCDVCSAYCSAGCSTAGAHGCNQCDQGYGRTTSGTCAACSAYCTTYGCITAGAGKCDQCDSGGYMMSNQTCTMCSTQCTTYGCSNSGAYKCDRCDQGYGRTSTGTCGTCSLYCASGCTSAGAYKCDQCNSGYITMSDGSCGVRPANELCPYGNSQRDTAYYGADDSNWHAYLPQSFRFGRRTFRDIYINVNGFVTFGQGYVSWSPISFPFFNYYNYYYNYANSYNYYYYDLPLIAIFWSDIDLRYGPGKIFYHAYSRDYYTSYVSASNKQVFDCATKAISTRTGDSGFWPSMVVVITWEKVSPYPAYYTSSETATFQMILASDYRYYQSYAIFNYKEFNGYNTWRSNGQGYQSDTSFYKNLFTSGSSLAYQLPSIVGEKGTTGQWIFSIADSLSYAESPEFKCYQWYSVQSHNRWSIDRARWFLPPCPCTLWQALWDPRYLFNFRTGCATNVFSSFDTYTQQCCYNFYGSYFYYYYFWWWWSPWWWGGFGFLDTSQSIQAGSLLQYNPYFYPQLHYQYDILPKRWCCLESYNCHLYYSVRPQDTCRNYRMPFFGFMFGDPHITTPDGKNYTFNGWGEYWLIKAEGIFYLQSRTDRTLDSDGNATNATVFTAFVAQSFSDSTIDNVTTSISSDKIFIGLDDAKTGMFIRVNDVTDLTSWFSSLPDGNSTFDYRGVVLGRKNTSIEASFSTGISISVKCGYQALEISTVVPQNLQGNAAFKGLLGNIDGNSDNDFLNSYGTTLPSDSSEKELFHNFGNTWMVQNVTETLFYYNLSKGESFESFQHLDFVPDFLADAADPSLVSAANQRCTVNGVLDTTCRYDYILTGGNDQMAANSLNSNNDFQVTTQDLGRTIVHILVDNKVTNWTLNVTGTVLISMSDSNSTEVLQLERLFTSPETELISVNATTWKFIWTPRDTDSVNFTFNGSDSSGSVAAPMALSVRLCGCQNNGSCGWNTLQSGYNDSDLFQIVSCACPEGFYDGLYCQNFFNACQADPCGPKRNCSLTYPGFACGNCLPGYEVVDNKCADIDECNQTNSTVSNICDPVTEICENSDGGYNCTCKGGFEKTGTVCQDIDECALRLDNCTQICNNTFGGYVCSCVQGFNLTDGYDCRGPNTPNCTCDWCTETAPCGCRPGYESSNSTCVDVNECAATVNPCGANSNCNNTDGDYLCSCHSGYLLRNGRYCDPCPAGWWGMNCSTLCQCSAGNCDNTAGCTACANSGYTGGDCDIDADECSSGSNPCPSNSVCNNSVGSFECICDPWYMSVADTCQLLDACMYDISHDRSVQALGIIRCQNAGYCKLGNVAAGNYACDCQPGWTGTYCEINIDECASTPCMYGGQCLDETNAFKCNCTDIHYGSFCQYNITATVVTYITNTCAANCTTFGCNVTGSGKCDLCDAGFGLTDNQTCDACATYCTTYGCNITGAYKCDTCDFGYSLNAYDACEPSLSEVNTSKTLGIVLGVLGAAALVLAGIIIFVRFGPLKTAGGAGKEAALLDDADTKVFTRSSRLTEPKRRFRYPSQIHDVEESRPSPGTTTVQPPEPIRPVLTSPAAATQSDMPVRWNILKNFQNRGPFRNNRVTPIRPQQE